MACVATPPHNRSCAANKPNPPRGEQGSKHAFWPTAELARKRAQYGANLPGFEGVVGTPETVIARLNEYVTAGAQYITFSMPDAGEIEPVRLFGETIIPAMSRLA